MPVEVNIRRRGQKVQLVAFAPFPDKSWLEEVLAEDIRVMIGPSS